MQEKIKVLVQMKYTRELRSALTATRLSASAVSSIAIPGFSLDESYVPVKLPNRVQRERIGSMEVGRLFTFDSRPEESTYLIRGEVENKDALNRLIETVKQDPNGVGVFSDPRIGAFSVNPQDAVGNHTDVANLLEISELQARGMDGSNVMVAIVDTGINIDYLRNKGVNANIDASKSWTPIQDTVFGPGKYPPDHGTMCAFDVCIAAPNCTLLDYALLRSTAGGEPFMEGFLGDAIKAYSKLLELLTTNEQNKPRLVVNNSWGMYDPSWDFPVGHPGNYSDNPNHPFNIIVESLDDAGADILFAAGNCGNECPIKKCNGATDRPIYGANSHPNVLCVAGVTIDKIRLCYSSQGPGRLDPNKPDICAYTHFKGSDVDDLPDTGTSAACPVAAGVIAAIRTVNSPNDFPPATLRNIIRRYAEDIGQIGFDYDHGFGILNVMNTIDNLQKTPGIREIQVGELVSGSVKETGNIAMFKLTAKGILNISLDGPEGVDFDLYVRKGAKPTTTEYDERGYTGSASENIMIQAEESSDFYIMVHSYSGAGDFRLKAIAE
ncbi:MAG TPA: S8 family serine peptidase [Candidatus Methanoperedens sp.]